MHKDAAVAQSAAAPCSGCQTSPCPPPLCETAQGPPSTYSPPERDTYRLSPDGCAFAILHRHYKKNSYIVFIFIRLFIFTVYSTAKLCLLMYCSMNTKLKGLLWENVTMTCLFSLLAEENRISWESWDDATWLVNRPLRICIFRYILCIMKCFMNYFLEVISILTIY